MPTTEHKCQQCGHTFCRVTLKGDDDAGHACPKCYSTDVKPSVQPAKLFNGIAGFSALAKDTN